MCRRRTSVTAPEKRFHESGVGKIELGASRTGYLNGTPVCSFDQPDVFGALERRERGARRAIRYACSEVP